MSIGPEVISGTVKGASGYKFTTVGVNDPGLVKDLDKRKVSYSGRYENKY